MKTLTSLPDPLNSILGRYGLMPANELQNVG